MIVAGVLGSGNSRELSRRYGLPRTVEHCRLFLYMGVIRDDVRIHSIDAAFRADQVLELVCADGVTVELLFPRHWTPTRNKELPEYTRPITPAY